MRSDPKYREFVTKKCGPTGVRTEMSATELWNELVIGYKATRRRKAFFIIIDRLNHSNMKKKQEEVQVFRHIVETSRQLRQHTTNFQVRLLWTGTTKVFQEYSERNGPQQGEIKISPTESQFRGDMQLYIRKRLEQARQRGASDIGLSQELLSEIEAKLIESNPMNYPSANVFLEDIETAIMIKNLQMLKGRNFNASAETLPWRIRKLNFSLEEAEIDGSNIILAYVFLMRESWPTIQQLELFLDRDHDGSLEAGIRDNLRFLFTLKPSGADITVQTKKEISASIPRVDYENELAQYIPQRKRLSRRKELPPRDSFFEDGQEILDEASPKQPNSVKRPKRQIEFSPTAGHFQFVSRILELICTSGSSVLDIYGTVWLPYHLKKVTLAHLNLEDDEKKKHIGHYMFKYLFDQKIVKKCMTLEALQQIRMLCYDWPTFLTEGVIEWLQDAAVRSGAQHYVEEVQDHKLDLTDFIDNLDPVGPLILPFKNWDHILLALMRDAN